MQIEDLYQDLIIEHGTKPRNFLELPNCSCSAEGYNPLCGDKLKIFVLLEDTKMVKQITFTGQGCAISTASASILTQELPGLEIEQVINISHEFKEALLREENSNNLSQRLQTLVNVKKYPSRIKCATLAWYALDDALKEIN